MRRFNLALLLADKCKSWINILKQLGYKFQGWNIRNICHTCEDGHCYDVISKQYGVNITASLAERAMVLSEII